MKNYKIIVIAFIWSQEEHRNNGAWTFVKPRFENLCGRKVSLYFTYTLQNIQIISTFDIQINYTGRYEGATPAVGVGKWHRKEAEEVISAPFDYP